VFAGVSMLHLFACWLVFAVGGGMLGHCVQGDRIGSSLLMFKNMKMFSKLI